MKNLMTKSILLWLLMLYSLPFHSRADTKTEYTVNNGSHALFTTVTDALHNVQATHTNGSGKTLKTFD